MSKAIYFDKNYSTDISLKPNLSLLHQGQNFLQAFGAAIKYCKNMGEREREHGKMNHIKYLAKLYNEKNRQ